MWSQTLYDLSEFSKQKIHCVLVQIMKNKTDLNTFLCRIFYVWSNFCWHKNFLFWHKMTNILTVWIWYSNLIWSLRLESSLQISFINYFCSSKQCFIILDSQSLSFKLRKNESSCLFISVVSIILKKYYQTSCLTDFHNFIFAHLKTSSVFLYI